MTTFTAAFGVRAHATAWAKACAGAIAAAALLGGPWTTDAVAQERSRSIDARVIGSVSGNEVIAMMRSLSAPTSLTAETASGKEKTLEARAGDGMVYIFLSDCNGTGAYAQCSTVQPTVYFTGAGVTLSQLNEFNMAGGREAVAGLLPDGRGIVLMRRDLTGGVTASHLRQAIEAFLGDAQTLLTSIDPTGASTVRIPAAAITPGSVGIAAGNVQTNGVGANAPTFFPATGVDARTPSSAQPASDRKVTNDR